MSLDITLNRVICDKCGDIEEVFDYNITHNLTTMAQDAGVYQALWRPEELGFDTSGELIEVLMAGLKRLTDRKVELKALNPTNGWGSYENLVDCVEQYLLACVKYPGAEISVCTDL